MEIVNSADNHNEFQIGRSGKQKNIIQPIFGLPEGTEAHLVMDDGTAVSYVDIIDVAEEINCYAGDRVEYVYVCESEAEIMDICKNCIGEPNIEFTVYKIPGIISHRLHGYNRWFLLKTHEFTNIIVDDDFENLIRYIFDRIGEASYDEFKEHMEWI